MFDAALREPLSSPWLSGEARAAHRYDPQFEDGNDGGGQRRQDARSDKHDDHARRAAAVGAELERVVRRLRELHAVDWPELTADEATAALASADHAEAALAAVRARLVAACEDAGAPERDGAANTTVWLKDRFRRSARQARSDTNLANKLADLPATRDALTSGRIGAEQAE